MWLANTTRDRPPALGAGHPRAAAWRCAANGDVSLQSCSHRAAGGKLGGRAGPRREGARDQNARPRPFQPSDCASQRADGRDFPQNAADGRGRLHLSGAHADQMEAIGQGTRPPKARVTSRVSCRGSTTRPPMSRPCLSLSVTSLASTTRTSAKRTRALPKRWLGRRRWTRRARPCRYDHGDCFFLASTFSWEAGVSPPFLFCNFHVLPFPVCPHAAEGARQVQELRQRCARGSCGHSHDRGAVGGRPRRPAPCAGSVGGGTSAPGSRRATGFSGQLLTPFFAPALPARHLELLSRTTPRATLKWRASASSLPRWRCVAARAAAFGHPCVRQRTGPSAGSLPLAAGVHQWRATGTGADG